MLRRLCDRPAAITSFLTGQWPRRPAPSHCAALGEALARLHLAGLDYGPERANALSLDSWRPLFEKCRAGADAVVPGLAAEVAATVERIEGDWPRDLPRGVVHADLFPDNVFFERGRLSGLIDFYFACNDALVYDLAVCLNAWCFEPDLSFKRDQGAPHDRPLPRGAPLLGGGDSRRSRVLRRARPCASCSPGSMTGSTRWMARSSAPRTRASISHKLRFHRGVADPRAYGIDP